MNRHNINFMYLSLVQKGIDLAGIKSSQHDEENCGPTTAEKYGYGFLAVFIVSALSLVGALIYPLTKKSYYVYINAFFTALAVGALFGNSTLDLLPAILQYDPNEEKKSNRTCNSTAEVNNHDGIPIFLWQMLILLLTTYVFYVIETAINFFSNFRSESDESEYDEHSYDSRSRVTRFTNGDEEFHRNRAGTVLSATFPNIELHTNSETQRKPAVAWTIIVGDGIHNVADGLAIGAAFADSILTGVVQSIAVGCQELPSEIGEFMVMMESGFTLRRALFFNAVSACTAFIGFFVGLRISENEGARIWIFCITAGTFTYIALVDLWPRLMPETEDFSFKRFFFVSAGYIVGIFLMFGLSAITEMHVPKV